MKSPPRQLWPPHSGIFFSLYGMTWRKHKVPKIKKILPYEINFLVPNYICLQNLWLGGYSPQIPVLSALCPQLNLLTPPEKKIPGYATGVCRNSINVFFHAVFKYHYQCTLQVSHLSMRLGIRTAVFLIGLCAIWQTFTDPLLGVEHFLWSAIWKDLWYVLLVPKTWKLSL